MFGRPLDVWALGVTFYKMVYGEGPFGTSFEPKEMGDRIVHDEYPPLTRPQYPDLSAGFRLPEDCRDLLVRMLDKNPRRRITTKEMLLHPFLQASCHPSTKDAASPQKPEPHAAAFKPDASGELFTKVTTKQTVELTLKNKLAV